VSRHAGGSADTTGMVRHQRLVTPVGGVLKFPRTVKIAAGVVLATGSVLGGAALATTSADVGEPAEGASGSQTAPTQTDSVALPPPAWSVPEHLFGLDLRLDDPLEFALPPTLTQQAVQISRLGPIAPGVPITTPHVGEIHYPARDGGPAAAPPAASGHIVLLAPVTGARRMAASFDNAGTTAGTGAAFAAQGAALRLPACQASRPTALPPPPQRPVLLAAGPVQLAPVRRPAAPAARESARSVDERVAPDTSPLIARTPDGGEPGNARQRPSDPAIAVLLAAPIDTPPADAIPADDTPQADVLVAATDVGVTDRSDVEQTGPPTDDTVRPTLEDALGHGTVADRMVADRAVEGSAVLDSAVTDTAAEDSAVTDTAVAAGPTDDSPTDDSPTDDSPTDDSPTTTGATDDGATVDETISAPTPEAQPVVAELADQHGDPLGSTASDA